MAKNFRSRSRLPFKGKRTKRTYSKSKEIDTQQYEEAANAILGFMRETPRVTFTLKDISRSIDWPANREDELRRAAGILVDRGLTVRVKGKKYRLAANSEQIVQGKISLAESGNGFLVTEENEADFFIHISRLHGASHGDLVEAIVLDDRGRSGALERAKVLRILEKNDSPMVGRFIRFPGRGGLFYPDNPRYPSPISISENNRHGAEEDTRVQVEIINNNTYRNKILGRVVKVFGKSDDSVARYKALIATHKFIENFSKKCIEEASSFDEFISEKEWEFREDLRDEMIITIDPDSAKDFDDALSLKVLDDGNYELGVHIADVSWYVRPETNLDKEAYARSTSVYSSHGTLPMLPHELSSDLCSLRQGVDRRTFSVFMLLNQNGEITHSRITRSVINSHKRLTYKEAQKRIEDGRKKWPDGLPKWRNNALNILLIHLDSLTKKLRRNRFLIGGLNLEVPEYEVILDEENKPEDIVERQVLEANHLVEECMLAANRCVTELALHAAGSAREFVYRVHDKPDPRRVEELADFVFALQFDWPFGREILSSRELNKWLLSLGDHPLANVISIQVLRSMAKAEYSNENIGHYGLAFNNYTHFTSPIRRYPDLVVHRLLIDLLDGNKKHYPELADELKRICRHTSERERAAQEFERDSLKIRQAEFFEKHMGEEFEGRIISLVPKGLFVEIGTTGTQGLLAKDELGAVFYDHKVNAFVEVTGRELWRPGKKVNVRVINADPHSGHVDLELA